jgi:hypothetical protein
MEMYLVHRQQVVLGARVLDCPQQFLDLMVYLVDLIDITPVVVAVVEIMKVLQVLVVVEMEVMADKQILE